MSKKTKRIIGVIIIIILIIGIIWLLNEYVKPEPTNLEPVNELPNEDMEESNIITNSFKEEKVNVISEPVEPKKEENEIVESKENDSENKKENKTEIVAGTSKSREEQAVDLAKKYYEKEYGSTDGVYFNYNDIYKDGRYIITVGSANGGSNTFLYVDLNTKEVSSER